MFKIHTTSYFETAHDNTYCLKRSYRSTEEVLNTLSDDTFDARGIHSQKRLPCITNGSVIEMYVGVLNLRC